MHVVISASSCVARCTNFSHPRFFRCLSMWTANYQHVCNPFQVVVWHGWPSKKIQRIFGLVRGRLCPFPTSTHDAGRLRVWLQLSTQLSEQQQPDKRGPSGVAPLQEFRFGSPSHPELAANYLLLENVEGCRPPRPGKGKEETMLAHAGTHFATLQRVKFWSFRRWSNLLWIWLVVWNMFYFPYIGNYHPNWLSYFSEELQPPTRDIYIYNYNYIYIYIYIYCIVKNTNQRMVWEGSDDEHVPSPLWIPNPKFRRSFWKG